MNNVLFLILDELIRLKTDVHASYFYREAIVKAKRSRAGAFQYFVTKPDYLGKRFDPQPLVTSTGRKGARVITFLLAVFNLVYLRADKIASFALCFFLITLFNGAFMKLILN
jgi:hypothetical protein